MNTTGGITPSQELEKKMKKTILPFLLCPPRISHKIAKVTFRGLFGFDFAQFLPITK